MQKKISENKLSFYLISSALILFYISDAVNKYSQVSYSVDDDAIENAFSLSIYIRFLYEIVFAFIILSNLNLSRKKILLTISIMLIVFLIGEGAFILAYKQNNYNLSYHFILLNKYLFVFVIYGGIYKITENWKDFRLITKFYENIVVINSLLIFLGLIFNITLFKSYYSQNFRYGYDGLIPAINEATLFYFLSISYFYYKHFILKETSWKTYLIIFSSLLLGTKTVYLFLVLLFLYHLKNNLSFKKRIVYTIISLLLISFVIIPIALNPKYYFLYESFIYVYEKDGFLSMITSGRFNVIETKISENLSHWNIVNYMFGGTDQFKFMIEMDFFDLFLFVGTLGSITMFVSYFNTIFQNKNKAVFFSFFTFCYFLFAFLSGHIFNSAANALNLVLVAIFLKNASFFKLKSITSNV